MLVTIENETLTASYYYNYFLSAFSQRQQTCLMRAAANGHSDIVQTILSLSNSIEIDLRVNFNAKDKVREFD